MPGANSQQPKKSSQHGREKLAQVRAEQARQERRRTLAVVGGIGVVVALVAAAGVWGVISARSNSDSDGSVAGVQSFKLESRDHVEGTVDYVQTPPVGGDHNPTWLNCGYYAEPVPSENAVHDMEHGAVWVTYKPTLPDAQVAQLRDLTAEQDFITVSPFPDLQSPVVASAWGYQLKLDSADDPRLDDFIRTYRLGKQTPELGAPCTGGIGQPTG